MEYKIVLKSGFTVILKDDNADLVQHYTNWVLNSDEHPNAVFGNSNLSILCSEIAGVFRTDAS